MGLDKQVAVFIDYDNIEISVTEAFGKTADVDWNRIFGYASQLGRVVVRRAYADWAESAGKQRQLLNLGVELIHVNSKRGKNAADIRIVLDLMELFYNKNGSFTHVLLVSGDGDFTELVHRLRAQGKTVIGLGVSGTTADFLVNACDKFVFYDKWQGVNKFKKPGGNGVGNGQTAQKPQPAQRKAEAEERPSLSVPAPIPLAKRLERYLNILASNKIRMTPTAHRPLIIYKIFEIVKANPDFTFNQLREFAQAFFANASPKIEGQLVADTLHQLFHTFCFEFDEGGGRIWDRRMRFLEDVLSAEDLLNKCDRKLLQSITADLGASEQLDQEIAAQILYGGVRNPKVLDHITHLLAGEKVDGW
jgi:uncharacterized LabA/DUF88 family protein